MQKYKHVCYSKVTFSTSLRYVTANVNRHLLCSLFSISLRATTALVIISMCKHTDNHYGIVAPVLSISRRRNVHGVF